MVGVPVKARFFEYKPVLPPFLGEIAFSVFLFPEPALTVTMAQVLTGDSPSTGTGEGTWEKVRRQNRVSRESGFAAHMEPFIIFGAHYT